ncbi:ribokinase [Paeniglutamicibacter sp. ABSL32-1]|uniref:ribokinase n=1 Tax=Paeniglutamicibacter quisquiliarum TaxID=2849498 RepID=UPI001C2CFDB7|nr:ribokinase [Paeniglutamicibacter quisquiliarum]MBV1778824.1 ribokinase [Paeniglutamicibacter quisquiliarum]
MDTQAPDNQAGRIIVVGSLNADLTIYTRRLPAPGETLHGEGFTVNPGGKSANQAVAAGKLGGNVALVGAVGRDANGTMLLESCAAAGVDVSQVRRAEGVETGVAVVTVDAHGENSIVISAGANGTLSPADVEAAAAAFEGAAVLCLCLEVGLETVEAAARAGADAGAKVLLNLSPYAPIPASLARLSDVLLVNAHEASQFLGGERIPEPDAEASAWEPVLEHLVARGLPSAVVTLGAEGSVVLDSTAETGKRIVRISPTRVDAVDTTGAGDAFTGGLAARLAAGDALADAAAFASVGAALAATRKGTQAAYPDAAAVNARLNA